jgi:hypothetical protein
MSAIATMKRKAREKPGMNPAAKRRPMETSATDPYMIMLMLGGMRMPSVPPAAMEPSTMRSLYRLALNAGMATTPMVAAVATLDPEFAASSADAAMLVCRRPPGRGASHLARQLYMRSVTPLRSIISPRSTKSGIEVMTKLFSTVHI